MLRTLACLLCVGATALLVEGRAEAQYVTYYSPVVVAPAPVVAYRPVAPVVTYSVARPVAYTVASPVVAPAPVAYTVARPVVATTIVQPVAVATTRWRPLLGGSVTRVRYRYRPVTYYGY